MRSTTSTPRATPPRGAIRCPGKGRFSGRSRTSTAGRRAVRPCASRRSPVVVDVVQGAPNDSGGAGRGTAELVHSGHLGRGEAGDGRDDVPVDGRRPELAVGTDGGADPLGGGRGGHDGSLSARHRASRRRLTIARLRSCRRSSRRRQVSRSGGRRAERPGHGSGPRTARAQGGRAAAVEDEHRPERVDGAGRGGSGAVVTPHSLPGWGRALTTPGRSEAARGS